MDLSFFRVLEKLARSLAERGVRAFYFVRTIYNYNEDDSEMPFEIEQG